MTAAAAAPARVDVLRVMDAATADCVWLLGNSIKTMSVSPERLTEVRDAMAQLIEAAKKAQAMMATPGRIEPRHRQELCDAIARCEMPRDPRIAALAQVSP